MIKFRAWDKEKNRMIYPSTLDVCFELDDDGINILDVSGEYPDDHVFPRIDSVLMEYTGLYDVNGKQYCQDDLVKWNGNIYRLIHGTYAFELYGFYYQMQDDPWDYFSEGAYLEGEIIGNIYADPELLSQGIE